MAMPLLPSLAAANETSAFPKRLIVFMSGNGTIAPNWTPQSANGRLVGMSTILEPLARHMSDITVIEGLDLEVGKRSYQPKGGFHAHERGLGGILTGRPLNIGNMEAESGFAQGISVDQEIANTLMGQTTRHSVQVGLISKRHSNGWDNRDTMVYAGDKQPLYHESDGRQLFNRLFGESLSSQQAYERVRQRRTSVLDYLKDDLARVEGKVSAEDRQRLQQHNTTFRDLETQLQSGPLACNPSGDPSSISNWRDENNMSSIAAFQLKMLVQAMACDVTRVATIQFGRGLGGLSTRFLGFNESWHALSHEGDSNADAQNKLTQMNRYIAERFAVLLDELKAVPEGDGTMLDNSVVLWVNELGKGNQHLFDDIPIVMAGSCQGFFKPGGRHLTFGHRPTNDLLITLCHAFGHMRDEFGVRELCSGPITELIA